MGFIHSAENLNFSANISFSTDNLISHPLNTNKLGIISCPGTKTKAHEILVPISAEILNHGLWARKILLESKIKPYPKLTLIENGRWPKFTLREHGP